MRVTDIGVAVDVTGTLAGTSVYIASEVFRSEIYEFSVDIYSLGIMLSEMWYGQPPFTIISSLKNLKEFGHLVSEGRRAEHDNKCKPPPPSWEKLMTKCWEADLTKATHREKCKDTITELYQTLQ